MSSMPGIEVLYYPTFEPPERWLRSFLLFFDHVKTVVPTDAQFNLSEGVSRILERMPDTFSTISPSEEDIDIDRENISRLEQGFQEISSTTSSDEKNSILLEFDDMGRVSIAGHAFLHISKTSEDVRELLIKYELLKPELSGVAKALGLSEGYLVVNEAASLLLLSHIADKIGVRNGMATVTDQPLDFTLNALNALPFSGHPGSAIKLATSIINLEIPEEVLFAEPKRFQEIREAYQDIRLPFQQMTIDLAQLYQLEAMPEGPLLQSRIAAIARGFDAELQAVKKSRFGRQLKRWSPLGIGSLVAIVAAAMSEPVISITSTVLTTAVEVVQELTSESVKESTKPQVQRMLAKMQKDIIKSSDVKKFL